MVDERRRWGRHDDNVRQMDARTGRIAGWLVGPTSSTWSVGVPYEVENGRLCCVDSQTDRQRSWFVKHDRISRAAGRMVGWINR